ncbi:MAG: hypothetical protein ABSE48_00070 [Verrucomicrobiota bacterium]|jgi:hypothetical protein
MKQLNKPASRIAIALLCLGFTGCQTHKTIAPLGGGYEEINHPVHSLLPDSTPSRTSLEYKDPDGKTITVWPSLYCFNEVVKGDLAIFVAEKAYLNDGDRGVHPRLFAVRSPAIPLDITDEVLWRWSKANGKDLNKTFNRFNVATPKEQNGELEVHLEFWQGSYMTDEDWPDTGDIQLDWQQVSEIMQAVEKKGVLQKDLRWNTSYIGEKF